MAVMVEVDGKIWSICVASHIKNAYWDCETNKIYGFYKFKRNSAFSHNIQRLKNTLN